ncbi:MFS transporter [Rhodococcus rhodochrous]|uniref:MFS transporter n=1 Tax=Rhodococcus rhodochrous TaxID=1829 RepID=UPI00188D0D3F|nr:MFS transporter [Rhodococcus rhodochrous]MBF4476686.1 MHS family MFS transporter [Rhodococcus rhodochrous]MCD2100453.1 MHS family MFS transporter [Rhodococcus rhodochrous]MCD2124777.1 MHS family MFS transporter [Rhodococcus rhodochrous]MCQ4138131.1 MHS family MFS transporter [Rhodococcus rhodochrous]MDJ0021636.1 MFS transporter [Rhodococcus rhodochrous]
MSDTTPSAPSTRERRQVAAASFIGTTIEWYDYFIYGSAAALVFAPQFFPTSDPLTGTLAAFATFAVGFIARPIGGIIMGHYGDRVGRKSMLVWSMMLMGVATVCIGLLPNYATIGIAAPIALVALRFVQGLGVGGEWGGAVLMAVEFAPRHRRALYGAFPQMGLPAGIIAANLVFLFVSAAVAPEAFASWGWRIPFLLSAALIFVGLTLRLKIGESPAFETAKADETLTKRPVVEVLAQHWRALLLASAASIAAPALGYLVLVYMLSYGVQILELPRTTMLWLIVLGSAVWLVAIAGSALAADRIGRKPVFLAGALLVTLWAFPFFMLVDTANPGLILLAFAVGTIGIAGMAGPQATLVAALFPAAVRYSGASLAYQVGSILGGALAPMIATALYAASGTSTLIALYMALLGVISFVALLFLHEGAHDLDTSSASPTDTELEPTH